MIKVNLSGAARKKTSKAGLGFALPASATPVVLVLIILGFAGGGYWWWSSLDKQIAELAMKIKQDEAQKSALENVIKQDQVYEARKKDLENRVKIIRGLQRNQVSPVMALDQLAEAIVKTNYVWISSLNQNNAVLSISGIGTSYDAVASLITNLNVSGYFKNVDLVGPVTESAPNYTFSLKCEFSPPLRAGPAAPAAGGN
jgi:Tfp pilus assembly protein PilN